jgi:type IV pilus assembly protein PilP
MVGSLLRRGQAVALVQADKLIYQVRTGHHLGQDQGKVINISDTAIDIEEIVQESAGTWTTRKVQLSIQGGK